MLMGSQSSEPQRRSPTSFTCRWSGQTVSWFNCTRISKLIVHSTASLVSCLLLHCRIRAAFKMAQRAIPLVADQDPVDVIYEDDDIIAVNKPAGVLSAPKHRFTVRTILRWLMWGPHCIDQATVKKLCSLQ